MAGFLTKAYEIFDCGNFSDCCGWGPKGETIVVKRIEDFSRNVLPRYFKHSNFQSFVRQLNMYDFHKTAQDPSNGEFSHQYFRKGRPELMENIRRKANYRDPKNKSKEVKEKRVVFGSGPKVEELDANSSVIYTDSISAESDKVLAELVQQRMIRMDMEKRLEELERRNSATEAAQRAAEGENYFLKRMVNETKQAQFVLQDKMERVMRGIYTAYANGSLNELPPGNRMISDRAAKNLTGMGSSFHDVCGFLQLESPVCRNGQPTPRYGPQTTQALNSLISPPSTATAGGAKGEQYMFDAFAGSVQAPLGLPANAVMPLVELPETPALGHEEVGSSSSGGGGGRTSKRKVTEISDTSSPTLTQTQAEGLTLNVVKEDLSYGDFLKKARVNADSVTMTAREASEKRKPAAAGTPVEVPSSAVFSSLKKHQDATLVRLDSLESTLESFLDMADDEVV